MSYFSNSGPTTRRYGDLSWPNIRSVWDGKDNENYLYKTYVLSRYTTFISASFAAFDISVLPRVVSAFFVLLIFIYDLQFI